MENMKNSISKEVVNESDKNPRQLRRCIELVRKADDSLPPPFQRLGKRSGGVLAPNPL